MMSDRNGYMSAIGNIPLDQGLFTPDRLETCGEDHPLYDGVKCGHVFIVSRIDEINNELEAKSLCASICEGLPGCVGIQFDVTVDFATDYECVRVPTACWFLVVACPFLLSHLLIIVGSRSFSRTASRSSPITQLSQTSNKQACCSRIQLRSSMPTRTTTRTATTRTGVTRHRGMKKSLSPFSAWLLGSHCLVI